MTERHKSEPAEAWRPPYLPPLPAPAGPRPVADFVPELATARNATPAMGEVAEVAPADAASPLPRTEPVMAGAPAVEAAPAARQETPAGREKGERVELAGYVAGNPWFGNDRRGALTCVFPLATHPEPDTTVIWKVRAKRDRAERLRGNVRRGDAVVVVGYLHREVFTRGTTKTVSEIVNLTALQKATAAAEQK